MIRLSRKLFPLNMVLSRLAAGFAGVPILLPANLKITAGLAAGFTGVTALLPANSYGTDYIFIFTQKETHPFKVRPPKPTNLSKTTYGFKQCPSSSNLYLLPSILKDPVTMAPVTGSK